MPAPSEYKLDRNDVHKPGAGRALDGTMNKTTITKKYDIKLKYAGLSYDEVKTILQATDVEYFPVQFVSHSGVMETRSFYRGNVSADFMGYGLNRWSLDLPLIER